MVNNFDNNSKSPGKCHQLLSPIDRTFFADFKAEKGTVDISTFEKKSKSVKVLHKDQNNKSRKKGMKKGAGALIEDLSESFD